MIRDTYKITKAEISASYTYHGSYYELRIWYEDMGFKTSGVIENIGASIIKGLVGIKKGDGFKKIQSFLNTEEGKRWLGDYLKQRDLDIEKDKIKDSIRAIVSKMDLESVKKYERFGMNLIKCYASKKLVDKLINDIDDDKYHLYLEEDNENFLDELEDFYENNKLTKAEYEYVLDYVENITEEGPECLLKSIIKCNPNLKD